MLFPDHKKAPDGKGKAVAAMSEETLTVVPDVLSGAPGFRDLINISDLVSPHAFGRAVCGS